MRREEVRGLIIYTVLIFAALIVGISAINPVMTEYGPDKMHPILFIVITIVVGYLTNALGHELLHSLGAVIGGYSVTSINVLRICFSKSDKKWGLSFKEFDGLTGETKIVPKKDKTNINPFMWCPIFGYAAEIAFCIVVYVMIKQTPEAKASWLAVAAIIMILVSSMLALYNFVPLKLDTTTDGYRMRIFSNPKNLEAYNQVLIMQDIQRRGEKIENVQVFEDITEYTAELNIIAMYKFLSEGKYEEATKIVDKLLENKKVLNAVDTNRLIAQKLYLEVLTKPIEEVKTLYDEICPDDVRRFIANDVSMESIRAYILIGGMIEGSEGEVLYAKSKIAKAKKKALATQIATEEKLVEKALEYVYENHPKWKKENTAE